VSVNSPLAIDLIAAARPNFMKIAPLYHALSKESWCRPRIVHTGQHYDANMSDAFFADLQMPKPEVHLNVGSGSHAEQTGRVMIEYEKVCAASRPNWIVVVGDVNSTLACALVGAKSLIPVAHLEAGLRSGDWSMPEEVNRVLTDQLADLLLLPSEDARGNLVREGIAETRIAFVGNVMIDTLRQQLPAALAAGTPARLGVEPGRYVVCTLHRPSNVDRAETLAPILEALRRIGRRLPVVLPLHPRTRQNAERFGLSGALDELLVTEPLGYRDMLSLTAQGRVVLTDSGGLQEETSSLGIPCVTLRQQTERPVTVTQGTNRLAPWPLTVGGIEWACQDALDRYEISSTVSPIRGWDGCAAQRIVAALAM